MPIKVTPVEPIGTYKSMCHVHYADRPHEWEERDVPIYPTQVVLNGRHLRRERIDAGLSMGDLARKLGIGVTDVSAVERGMAFVEEGQDEWIAALGKLNTAKGE